MKRCSKCKVEKALSEFGNDRSRGDCKYPQCKSCQRAISNAWKKRNPEKVKKANREWSRKNPEGGRKAAREWRARNLETARANSKAYYAKNSEKLCADQRARAKRIRKENPDLLPRQKRALHAKKCGVPEHLLNAVEASIIGPCWVCGELQGTRKYLHSIDHNHKTGEFRGILCSGCNTAIGLLKDSPEIGESLVQYIRNPPGIDGLRGQP